MGRYGHDNCRRPWNNRPEDNSRSNRVRRLGRRLDCRKMAVRPSQSGTGRYRASYWVRASGVNPTTTIKHRRSGRAVGFWLGGILFAAGGCLFGATRAYEQPVGVAISAVWWSIYFGCFGTSIGALLGLWAEKLLDRFSWRPESQP